MHIDESKKFDKRNIEKNLKEKIITQKEYETYLARLPDVSDKIYIPGEAEEQENEEENESKKRKIKKKSTKG